jgi:hypothetical protein
MDEIAATLFNLAADVAQDDVGLGAPVEFVVAVEEATGLERTDAVTVAKLIVQAMAAQRAVDLCLSGAADPSDDFDDCLAPD